VYYRDLLNIKRIDSSINTHKNVLMKSYSGFFNKTKKIIKKCLQPIITVDGATKRVLLYNLYRSRPSLFKFNRLLNRYIKTTQGNNALQIARLFLLYADLRKIARKDISAIVILDEGFIQHIASLTLDNRINDNDHLDALISHLLSRFDTSIIYSYTEIDINISRIKERNRKGDRFNLDNECEIREKLLIMQHNIDLIYRLFKGKKCNMDMSLPVNDLVSSLAYNKFL